MTGRQQDLKELENTLEIDFVDSEADAETDTVFEEILQEHDVKVLQ